MSGLIPVVLNANDDFRMPQYGIGFTNIVQRPSKAGSDITKFAFLFNRNSLKKFESIFL